ncbi:hypothetical protein Taro_030425 [Colocasia esculenta]|uniref:Uncharacterized protein n=1 Tax=Colocasia esculenta TaxID=4460 RepID=A0A843W3A6_COLES|nr:hypothetical protein [Colocasia esculenta]
MLTSLQKPEDWRSGKPFSVCICRQATVYLSTDPTLWREHALTWMRRDDWQGLSNTWAVKRWQESSPTMKGNRAANLEANKHTSGSVSFATHQYRLENELKQALTFQEVFDKTQKKKGTDQYISDKAREVVSMDTSRVLSGASSSGSQETSAFTTLSALGTSPRDEISGLESRLVHTM